MREVRRFITSSMGGGSTSSLRPPRSPTRRFPLCGIKTRRKTIIKTTTARTTTTNNRTTAAIFICCIYFGVVSPHFICYCLGLRASIHHAPVVAEPNNKVVQLLEEEDHDGHDVLHDVSSTNTVEQLVQRQRRISRSLPARPRLVHDSWNDINSSSSEENKIILDAENLNLPGFGGFGHEDDGEDDVGENLEKNLEDELSRAKNCPDLLLRRLQKRKLSSDSTEEESCSFPRTPRELFLLSSSPCSRASSRTGSREDCSLSREDEESRRKAKDVDDESGDGEMILNPREDENWTTSSIPPTDDEFEPAQPHHCVHNSRRTSSSPHDEPQGAAGAAHEHLQHELFQMGFVSNGEDLATDEEFFEPRDLQPRGRVASPPALEYLNYCGQAGEYDYCGQAGEYNYCGAVSSSRTSSPSLSYVSTTFPSSSDVGSYFPTVLAPPDHQHYNMVMMLPIAEKMISNDSHTNESPSTDETEAYCSKMQSSSTSCSGKQGSSPSPVLTPSLSCHSAHACEDLADYYADKRTSGTSSARKSSVQTAAGPLSTTSTSGTGLSSARTSAASGGSGHLLTANGENNAKLARSSPPASSPGAVLPRDEQSLASSQKTSPILAPKKLIGVDDPPALGGTPAAGPRHPLSSQICWPQSPLSGFSFFQQNGDSNVDSQQYSYQDFQEALSLYNSQQQALNNLWSAQRQNCFGFSISPEGQGGPVVVESPWVWSPASSSCGHNVMIDTTSGATPPTSVPNSNSCSPPSSPGPCSKGWPGGCWWSTPTAASTCDSGGGLAAPAGGVISGGSCPGSSSLEMVMAGLPPELLGEDHAGDGQPTDAACLPCAEIEKTTPWEVSTTTRSAPRRRTLSGDSCGSLFSKTSAASEPSHKSGIAGAASSVASTGVGTSDHSTGSCSGCHWSSKQSINNGCDSGSAPVDEATGRSANAKKKCSSLFQDKLQALLRNRALMEGIILRRNNAGNAKSLSSRKRLFLSLEEDKNFELEDTNDITNHAELIQQNERTKEANILMELFFALSLQERKQYFWHFWPQRSRHETLGKMNFAPQDWRRLSLLVENLEPTYAHRIHKEQELLAAELDHNSSVVPEDPEESRDNFISWESQNILELAKSLRYYNKKGFKKNKLPVAANKLPSCISVQERVPAPRAGGGENSIDRLKRTVSLLSQSVDRIQFFELLDTGEIWTLIQNKVLLDTRTSSTIISSPATRTRTKNQENPHAVTADRGLQHKQVSMTTDVDHGSTATISSTSHCKDNYYDSTSPQRVLAEMDVSRFLSLSQDARKLQFWNTWFQDSCSTSPDFSKKFSANTWCRLVHFVDALSESSAAWAEEELHKTDKPQSQKMQEELEVLSIPERVYLHTLQQELRHVKKIIKKERTATGYVELAKQKRNGPLRRKAGKEIIMFFEGDEVEQCLVGGEVAVDGSGGSTYRPMAGGDGKNRKMRKELVAGGASGNVVLDNKASSKTSKRTPWWTKYWWSNNY